MAARDDDALSWDGDDDPTLDVGVPAAPRDASIRPNAAGDTDAGPDAGTRRGAQSVPAVPTPASLAAPAPMDNVTLVSLGVLGGIYLLLAVGWFIGGSRLQFVAQLFLNPTGYIVTWAIAVLAPAIWFVTVLVLTRGRRGWVRMLLLVIGAVVLLPWPFLLVGVGA
jgi:hypothetical protein